MQSKETTVVCVKATLAIAIEFEPSLRSVFGKEKE